MVVCRFSKHGLAAFFQIGRKDTEYIPLNTNYLFFFYSYFHILSICKIVCANLLLYLSKRKINLLSLKLIGLSISTAQFCK